MLKPVPKVAAGVLVVAAGVVVSRVVAVGLDIDSEENGLPADLDGGEVFTANGLLDNCFGEDACVAKGLNPPPAAALGGEEFTAKGLI